MPRISFLLPTRGRPALARRFLDSVVRHSHGIAQVEVIVYVDEDDTGSHDIGSDAVAVTRIIGPRRTMGGYNAACLRAARGQIIVLANDDMVIGTDGWDTRLIEIDESNPDKIYLAYCNDLFKKKRVCTFPVLSRRSCELLVEPFPDAYQGAFIDSHLFDIFTRLKHAGFDRIRYLDDVIFEHLHYRTGKAPFDDTYRRRDRFADDWTYLGLIGARRRAAQRLTEVLRGGSPITPVNATETPGPQAQSLAAAFVFFSRQFLFDTSLPVGWRTYLWVYFIARHLASKGLLRPFVR